MLICLYVHVSSVEICSNACMLSVLIQIIDYHRGFCTIGVIYSFLQSAVFQILHCQACDSCLEYIRY